MSLKTLKKSKKSKKRKCIRLKKSDYQTILDYRIKQDQDVLKAKTILVWEPIIGLEEWIKKTNDYFMEKNII